MTGNHVEPINLKRMNSSSESEQSQQDIKKSCRGEWDSCAVFDTSLREEVLHFATDFFSMRKDFNFLQLKRKILEANNVLRDVKKNHNRIYLWAVISSNENVWMALQHQMDLAGLLKGSDSSLKFLSISTLRQRYLRFIARNNLQLSHATTTSLKWIPESEGSAYGSRSLAVLERSTWA